MKAAPLLFLLWLAVLPLSIAEEICTCAEARSVNGWCEAHAVGYVAGLEIRSAELFEALDTHGHFMPNLFGSRSQQNGKQRHHGFR